MKPNILVIDDDISVLSAFQLYLEDSPVELTLLSSSYEAVERLRLDPKSFACAFIDYQLLNEFGEQEPIGHQVVKDLKAINPALYMVIMSGDDSQQALQNWLASGAEKFIYKPLNSGQILTYMEHALTIYQERNPLRQDKLINLNGLVGISANIKQVSHLVKKFAPSDEAVLILGETGTGKELIANAVHLKSKRNRQAFVAINCAAITDSLFESELFGHTKGAFTGADSSKIGRFREAHGGTLFLDEIHHLSLSQQAKILRVIQEKVVRPVGDKNEYAVDFRLICASKPNLRGQSLDNKFMIDLFFRISSLNIEVAPLRDRPDDIEPLVHLLQKKLEEKNKTFKRFSPNAMKKLKEHSWPGNVRELQKIIGELYLLIERSTITESDLPSEVLGNNTISLKDGMTMQQLDQQQRHQKRSLIKSIMAKTQENKTKSASLLGMKRSTFIWLLQDLGIYDAYGKKSLRSVDECSTIQSKKGIL